jgi:hypothetical protein
MNIREMQQHLLMSHVAETCERLDLGAELRDFLTRRIITKTYFEKGLQGKHFK